MPSMAKQWQQPWEPLQPQAALLVLTIHLNGNENYEQTDCCLVEMFRIQLLPTGAVFVDEIIDHGLSIHIVHRLPV
jgi:hypothetical protein